MMQFPGLEPDDGFNDEESLTTKDGYYWKNGLRATFAAQSVVPTRGFSAVDYVSTLVEIIDQESGIVTMKIGGDMFLRVEKEVLFRAIRNFIKDNAEVTP